MTHSFLDILVQTYLRNCINFNDRLFMSVDFIHQYAFFYHELSFLLQSRVYLCRRRGRVDGGVDR